jgi:hypothetical protein
MNANETKMAFELIDTETHNVVGYTDVKGKEFFVETVFVNARGVPAYMYGLGSGFIYVGMERQIPSHYSVNVPRRKK